MKHALLLSTLLLTASAATQAQIPNAGFEDWTDMGGYNTPDGWATTNGSVPNNQYNACSRSTDHFPAGIGQYSMRLETNLLFQQGGWGISVTDTFAYPFQPSFPVIGNPTSLHGHFKFTSVSGDQAWVKLVLFNQGAIVADVSFVSEAQSYPNWTPFELQLDDYGDADSATVMIFNFYPSSQDDGPNGNSVLWVDNLSFNSPITSVSEPQGLSFNLYPNPATDMVTLTLGDAYADGQTVAVYSLLGSLVKSEAVRGTRHQMDVSSLPAGIYVVELRSAGQVTNHKLHIVR